MMGSSYQERCSVQTLLDSQRHQIFLNLHYPKPQKMKSKENTVEKIVALTAHYVKRLWDEAHVSIPSCDPPQSGEDRMKLIELMNLCAQEDASKQGRKIVDLDADSEVTLVDETQEMNDDNLMFDTSMLEEHEKDVAEKEVSTVNPVTTAGEVVTTANVVVSTVNAPITTIDEFTLAQTLLLQQLQLQDPRLEGL
ncbi:hypothetical protein Tco_0992454 [Tanacetum coccineum]|uniref:Uncharacterized protein n=1 Tax=Tanacetum coccineum TaxID=301880 RepID=A0ABQ5F2B9_9ASTR